MAADYDPEELARKTFRITMIGSVLFIGGVFAFIIL